MTLFIADEADVQLTLDRSARMIRSFVKSKSEPPPRPNMVTDLVTEKPYFGMYDNITVIVQLGKTAYLNCVVNKIADKTVSFE